MRHVPALLAATTAALASSFAQAQVLLNETFDDGLAASRFDVRQIDPASIGAVPEITFNYNYGAYNYVSYASGTVTPLATPTVQAIPTAPESGGTTTGLRMRLVPGGAGTSTILAMGVLPKSVTVADNFKIEGYMWLNYNGNPGDQFASQGGAGSTEYMTVGLRRSGDTLTGPFPVGANSPGYAFTMTGEGGTVADNRMHNTDVGDDGPAFFKRNGAWFAGGSENRYDLTTGNLILAGTPPALIDDTPDNHAHSYYRSEVFKSSDGFEIAGAPAKKWIKFEVEQHGRISTYTVNGKAIAVLFNTESFSGTPQFGYFDRFNGLAPNTVEPANGLNNRENQFVLYDNLKVTHQPAAAANAISLTSNYAAFGTGGTYDAAGAATISYLEIGTADPVTIGGTGTLTIGQTLAAIQSIGGGVHTISKPVNINADAAISVVGTGTLAMPNISWAANVDVNKTGAGTLQVQKIRVGSLMLNDGKTAITGAGPANAGKVTNLDVGYVATTQIDIGRTVLAVDYVARGSAEPTITNSPLTVLVGRLNSGYNADPNGLAQWNGPGIITSAPEVLGAGFLTSPYTVRIFEASLLGYTAAAPYGTTGLTVDGSTVLLGFSFKADLNFDQTVSFPDLVLLAQNYNLTGKAFYEGDADGSTVVDFADLVLLAQSYGQTVGPFGAPIVDAAMAASFQQDWELAQSLVPEPTSLSLLGLGALAMVRRRK